MLTYIALFVISTTSLYFSQRIKNRKYAKILIFIALLLPCIVAGLRSCTVGTDANWYPKLLFDMSSVSTNYTEYLQQEYRAPNYVLYTPRSFEFGFQFLIYILQKIFNNIQVIYFSIEAVIILPIYFGLKKYNFIKKNKLIWLGFLVYLIFLYNPGLNIMRQMMAVSLVFYGTSCLINNDKSKVPKFLISIIAGTSFHMSAFIGLIFPTLYMYINGKKSLLTDKITPQKNINKNIKVKIIIVAIICLILLSVPSFIIGILKSVGFTNRYLYYFSSDLTFSASTLLCIPVIVLFIRNKTNFLRHKNAYFFILLYIIYLATIQLSTGSDQGARMMFCFQVFYTVILPLLSISSRNAKDKRIYIILILFALSAYWIYKFVYKGYHNTIPYELFL